MDFFRKHRKLIIGIITVSFILWMAGLSLLLFVFQMNGA